MTAMWLLVGLLWAPGAFAEGWIAPSDNSLNSGIVRLQADVPLAQRVEFQAYYATDPADITTVGWHGLGAATRDVAGTWTFDWDSRSIPDQGNAGWGTVNLVAIPFFGPEPSSNRFYRRIEVRNGQPPPGWVAPASESTLTGIVTLRASAAAAQRLDFHASYATDPANISTVGWRGIGSATRGSDGVWSLQWDSRSIPNQGNAGWGTVNIVAIPYYGPTPSDKRYYRRFDVSNGADGSPPRPPPPPPPPPVRYAIADVTSVNLRAGPGTTFAVVGALRGRSPIDIVCQTVGESINGSPIWDQLTSGAYVSDWYATTPVVGDYSPGIPRCAGAPDRVHPPTPQGRWKVVAAAAVSTRSGPSTSSPPRGALAPGTRLDITCQTYGSYVLGSPVWNRLSDGRYISDYYADTPVYANFSPGIPTCPGTGARPNPSPGGGSSGGGSTPPGATPLVCSTDIVFIGARGSGEKFKDAESGMGHPVSKIYSVVRQHFGERVAGHGVPYPALPVQALANRVDVGNISGERDAFDASVRDGASLTSEAIIGGIREWKAARCRGDLKFFLAGYSQGAWVIGDALSNHPALVKPVKGVALLGDPKFEHTSFAAQSLDPLDGLDGPRRPYLPKDLQGRSRSYCRVRDPICNWAFERRGELRKCVFLQPACSHFHYASTDRGLAWQAGTYLAGRR